jgi:hypothetical protein
LDQTSKQTCIQATDIAPKISPKRKELNNILRSLWNLWGMFFHFLFVRNQKVIGCILMASGENNVNRKQRCCISPWHFYLNFKPKKRRFGWE